jgi:hypothetical protein
MFLGNAAAFHDKKNAYTAATKAERLFVLQSVIDHCGRKKWSNCDVCSARFTPIPYYRATDNMWVAQCRYVNLLLPPRDFPKAMARLFDPPNAWRHPRASSPRRGGEDDPIAATGRFAMDHWVFSHPYLRPCDVFDSDPAGPGQHDRGDAAIGIKEEANLQLAPRVPLAQYVLRYPKSTTVFGNHLWYELSSRKYAWESLYGVLPMLAAWQWSAYGESNNISDADVRALQCCEMFLDLQRSVCNMRCGTAAHIAACRPHANKRKWPESENAIVSMDVLNDRNQG